MYKAIYRNPLLIHDQGAGLFLVVRLGVGLSTGAGTTGLSGSIASAPNNDCLSILRGIRDFSVVFLLHTGQFPDCPPLTLRAAVMHS